MSTSYRLIEMWASVVMLYSHHLNAGRVHQAVGLLHTGLWKFNNLYSHFPCPAERWVQGSVSWHHCPCCGPQCLPGHSSVSLWEQRLLVYSPTSSSIHQQLCRLSMLLLSSTFCRCLPYLLGRQPIKLILSLQSSHWLSQTWLRSVLHWVDSVTCAAAVLSGC